MLPRDGELGELARGVPTSCGPRQWRRRWQRRQVKTGDIMHGGVIFRSDINVIRFIYEVYYKKIIVGIGVFFLVESISKQRVFPEILFVVWVVLSFTPPPPLAYSQADG